MVRDEVVDDLGADEQVEFGLGGACGRVEGKESVRRERVRASVREGGLTGCGGGEGGEDTGQRRGRRKASAYSRKCA